MTAGQVFTKAMQLLGYVTDGHSGGIKSRAIALINAAYVDVCRASRINFEPVRTLAEKFALDNTIITDVLVYGVAMFIAQSEGDSAMQAVYCDLYNRKRGSLATSDAIIDVLPRG